MSPAERTLSARFPASEKYGRNYAAATNKPGVLAFRNERAGWMPKLRTEKMTVGGKAFKLISYCGGEWEVYRIEADDYTETFLGYARDIIARLAKGTIK